MAQVRMEDTEVQVVLLGKGENTLEVALQQAATRYTGRLAVFTGYDDSLSHLIYGSCDMILMPSKFEPCGLGQLIAMRYGAIPVVRHTGGLADTVLPFNSDLTAGNGFVFYEYSSGALLAAIKQATEAFANRSVWRTTVKLIMQLDYSWGISARKYEKMYFKLLEINRNQKSSAILTAI